MSIFKHSIIIDMSFPPEKSFNPPISKTPILGPSSGNPKSFQDPNSVASVGSTIQAMSDQAAADTLYDAPVPKREGFRQGGESFRNEVYSPWILRTQACSKTEGFLTLNPQEYKPYKTNNAALVLIILGVTALLVSFYKRK